MAYRIWIMAYKPKSGFTMVLSWVCWSASVVVKRSTVHSIAKAMHKPVTRKNYFHVNCLYNWTSHIKNIVYVLCKATKKLLLDKKILALDPNPLKHRVSLSVLCFLCCGQVDGWCLTFLQFNCRGNWQGCINICRPQYPYLMSSPAA